MKVKKTISLSISILLVILIISGTYIGIRTKNQIKGLFHMNKELQEDGYYMAEFEFKMLGIAYYLDKGHYLTALSRINEYYHQLKARKGLVKVPKFKSKEEEYEFYLQLQNPKTGAFMDDSYPYCTYTGPTGNVLIHLDELAVQLGKPLKLKYPLKYLNEINTPEKMKAYLDDVSTVGWIASKLPQTTFHNARDVLSLFYEDRVVDKYNLYQTSPGVREALVQWFYDNQDPETGLWGPKSKSGKLRRKDVMNTVSIMEKFVDEEGKNIDPAYPLRYKDQLSRSILEKLATPVPDDDEFDEWHEWNLETSKAIRALLKYLWDGISKENKAKIKDFIEDYMTLKFEKFYIPEEGSFCYYPYGEHATIDGTTGFRIFERIGAYSTEQQKKLWGAPKENIRDLGIHKLSSLKKSDFDLIGTKPVNSLRIYKSLPNDENLTSNVIAVFYPKKPIVLDIMDVAPKVKHWIQTSDQTMGNWTSKEDIIRELEKIQFEEVPVYENDIPIESANDVLKKNRELTVIGFDILQVPRYKITYKFLK